MPPSLRSTAWTDQLRTRFFTHLVVKTLGITGFMWVFFIGYFHLLRHPVHPVTVMPLTPLDDWLAFRPEWLPAYLSLWLYVGIAPGLLLTMRGLIVHGLWAAALCATGFAFFFWWPTAVPAMTVDVAQHAGFALLQGVDAAGNACPSLHVATAMFTTPNVDRILRDVRAPWVLRGLNVAWFLAIAYSTVAIRQHVVLDALAGAALGAVFAAAALRWRPRDAHAHGPAVTSGVPGRQGHA